MGKLWIGVLAAAAGFAVGVLVAKAKYESKVRGGVHDALNKVNLAGGTVESAVDSLLGVGT